MGYPKRTLNYLERIASSNPTHMTSMVDHMTIIIKTPRIHSLCSLEKEFIELIRMNPLMVLCQTVNHHDIYHGCIHDPLT